MSEIEKYKNRNRTLRIDKMSLLKTIERRNDEIKQLKSQLQQKENIIKEVREYIENNWISKKDADNYRFDDEELDIEISDIAVLYDILDKGE